LIHNVIPALIMGSPPVVSPTRSPTRNKINGSLDEAAHLLATIGYARHQTILSELPEAADEAGRWLDAW
jgi:hypothetical protein